MLSDSDFKGNVASRSTHVMIIFSDKHVKLVSQSQGLFRKTTSLLLLKTSFLRIRLNSLHIFEKLYSIPIYLKTY